MLRRRSDPSRSIRARRACRMPIIATPDLHRAIPVPAVLDPATEAPAGVGPELLVPATMAPAAVGQLAMKSAVDEKAAGTKVTSPARYSAESYLSRR